MNILQLAFHTSPFNEVGKNDGGGMSIYVQQISRHLSDNHNVTVVTGEKAESFKDNNLEFISLNIFEPELNVEDKEVYLQEFKNKLEESLDLKSFDIIHAHYWLSGLVAKEISNQLKIPFIFTSHSLGVFLDGYNKERVDCEKIVMTSSDLVTASSVFETMLITDTYKVDENKIRKITPGVDRELFSPDLSVKKENIFLSIGRIQEQKRQLENAISKQRKFMDGDISKKKLTKSDKAAMDAVESAGMSYVDVAKDMTDRWSGKKTPTKVLLVKKFNKALAESDTVSMIYRPDYTWGSMEENQKAINDGLVKGTILGRKLQVRGESRETKWTRLDSGRIDKRLIAELGFGNERVFNSTFVESYSDAFLHISVDASGSMSGRKWLNTQTCVAAIAKACSMINNVDLVISYRSTQSSGSGYRRRSDKNYPLMLVAYDSRVDKISKVKNIFNLLHPSGTTPEGLCFEAVMKEIEPASKDKDSYFLNFSDGMPMFGNDDIDYHHDTAIDHTNKMVKMIRDRGVKVLSYFIGDEYDMERSTRTFKRMYGNDAEFIDVTSVLPVAKTMNKAFLKK